MSSRQELAYNAVQWMKEFKQKREQGAIDKNLGTILVYFNNDDPTGSAVCVSSINHAGVVDACKSILKKLGEDPDRRIIRPGDFLQ